MIDTVVGKIRLSGSEYKYISEHTKHLPFNRTINDSNYFDSNKERRSFVVGVNTQREFTEVPVDIEFSKYSPHAKYGWIVLTRKFEYQESFFSEEMLENDLDYELNWTCHLTKLQWYYGYRQIAGNMPSKNVKEILHKFLSHVLPHDVVKRCLLCRNIYAIDTYTDVVGIPLNDFRRYTYPAQTNGKLKYELERDSVEDDIPDGDMNVDLTHKHVGIWFENTRRKVKAYLKTKQLKHLDFIHFSQFEDAEPYQSEITRFEVSHNRTDWKEYCEKKLGMDFSRGDSKTSLLDVYESLFFFDVERYILPWIRRVEINAKVPDLISYAQKLKGMSSKRTRVSTYVGLEALYRDGATREEMAEIADKDTILKLEKSRNKILDEWTGLLGISTKYLESIRSGQAGYPLGKEKDTKGFFIDTLTGEDIYYPC